MIFCTELYQNVRKGKVSIVTCMNRLSDTLFLIIEIKYVQVNISSRCFLQLFSRSYLYQFLLVFAVAECLLHLFVVAWLSKALPGFVSIKNIDKFIYM